MSTEIPPSKIINVLEAAKDSSGLFSLDISPSLGLEGIVSVHYCQIPSGSQQDCQVEQGKNSICYILTGEGQLKKGERTAPLTSSDCFSFAASETTHSFSIIADKSAMTVLLVSDVDPAQRMATAPSPDFPTIVSAEKSAVWRGKGIDTTKAVRLATLTDMKNQERLPWGFTLECIPPGTQSSNAHAHLIEDEFALILAGNARYWHQGETPERILSMGDAVGWKANTGICHTLLNDGTDENGGGENVVFLVWGKDDPDGDKVHYATASPHWWTKEVRWWDCPIHPVGPASGIPRYPRPEDRPFPS